MMRGYVASTLAASLPLQLVSSPYLSGVPTSEPSYSSAQSVALVSGAMIAGESLLSASGNTLSISAGFIAISGQDFFAAPACALSCSLSSGWGAFYVWKKQSGADASSAKLGFLSTPSATSASTALSALASSLTGVYVPLAVVEMQDGEMSLEWELDKNSQYSEPIFNQLSSILSWQAGTKSFLEAQLSALMTDLTGFASWEQSAHANQVYVSFDTNASANGISVLGEWSPGGKPNFVLPNITGSYLTRTYSLTLCPFTVTNPVQTITFPQVHNTYDGQDGWFAPSEPLYFPAACSCWENGSCVGVINAQWLTSGDLVLSGSSPVGQQHIPNCSTLAPITDGVYILGYSHGKQVATMPPNPLANPTFHTGW